MVFEFFSFRKIANAGLLVTGLLWSAHSNAQLGFNTYGSFLDIKVVVDGVKRPVHYGRGKLYIEALKNKEYEIHVHNLGDATVAVAVAVDGLNSFDAKRTSAGLATKWVIKPRDNLIVKGWQLNNSDVRRFLFTTEEKSVGAKLGHTSDLGNITVVAFRQKTPLVRPQEVVKGDTRQRGPAGGKSPGLYGLGGVGSGKSVGAANSAGANMTPNFKSAPGAVDPAGGAPVNDSYAATGQGTYAKNDISMVNLDLEPRPFLTRTVRYEFRDALIKLGVIPAEDPLSRREQGNGYLPVQYAPDLR